MKTKDARSLSGEAQEALRIRAVTAVLSGRTQVEVARLYKVSRQAINRWLSAYKRDGNKGLQMKRHGRPPGDRRLKPWQAAHIVKAIKDHCPDQLKLPFYLWTRPAVVQLIARRFCISVSLSTVGRYLKRWGFTPQKPVRRAYERNDQAVRDWLQHEYPAVRRRAKRERAAIYWGDEMGLRSDDTVGRSYGRRGQTPVIPGSGQRFGCSLISGVTNQGQLHFMVFKDQFNTEVFINYLKRLIKQLNHNVFLIVDSHPVHRAKKVKTWVEQHCDKLRLFFLPGYSPDLNPDEMVNQDVKSNALGTRRPHNQAEMIKNVRSYLFSRQKQPQIVKNYFKEQSVRYAA